ncbi:hypothetical protein H8D85_02420 [bacterium]|nr:hypothetical protein [bacterium]
MKNLTKTEAELLWRLMPTWIKECEEGLDPTFYGTGSYEGDLLVQQTVRRVLNRKNEVKDE